MTDSTHGLLAEAKKNKFSTIRDSLSEDDVAAVWENVSGFIEKQMSLQKGINIQGLGTFTFTQKKLDIGNNKYILIQRPIFMLSEKFAQTHALVHPKYHVPGQIPIVQLNYSALSFESPYDRDSVESCVKEILGAVSRSVGAKKNVELTFNGIGRLSIRDTKVKMKFYKEFIHEMDGTGKLMESLQNRPGTVDSVMSERPGSRPGTSNTIILPKISNTQINNGGLDPITEHDELHQGTMGEPLLTEQPSEPLGDLPAHPPDYQEVIQGVGIEDSHDVGDFTTDHAFQHIMDDGTDPHLDVPPPDPLYDDKPPSRSGSRLAMPMAQASGISLTDDFLTKPSPPLQHPKSSPYPSSTRPVEGFTPRPPGMPRTPPKLDPIQRAHSMDHITFGKDKVHMLTPPGTACGHPKAGQELCYLCHQRARRNIPVSFSDERKKREEEEDRLLQQFRTMKDAEETIKEQETHLGKRHDLQKMAAFNLGVSEAVNYKKKARDVNFHPSYVFQKRPLTPPRFYKQDEYSRELGKQVDSKEQTRVKRKSDDDFLERLEQVQLAEDLAAQREQYLKDKRDQQDMYKNALDSQIRIRNMFRRCDGLLRTPPLRMGMHQELHPIYPSQQTCMLPMFTALSPKIIRPFSEKKTCSYSCRLNEDIVPLHRRTKFKPLPMPAKQPDSEVFGQNDMTNEKMADRRRRAYDLFREQQDLVAQRKREAILRRLAEQKEEEVVLDRTKNELLEDRAKRFEVRFNTRKRVETDWAAAAELKRAHELEDRLRSLSPGVLVHEQCDKYKRCRQCQRKVANCGESNIWSESRYIPGSRLMV